MIDTEKYEGAKKIVEDAGLIDDNEGHLDVHYRKIADLLKEVERLRKGIHFALSYMRGHRLLYLESLIADIEGEEE